MCASTSTGKQSNAGQTAMSGFDTVCLTYMLVNQQWARHINQYPDTFANGWGNAKDLMEVE